MANGGSSRYQNAVMVGVVVTAVLFGVSLAQIKVSPILTNIMETYAMTASGVSWMMSIFTLVGVFAAIPAGVLARRFGAKPLILLAALISIVGAALGAFAGEAWLLVLSRAVEGVGFIVVCTCGATLIQKCVSPEKLGTAMGIWGTGLPLGSVVAGFLTPSAYAVVGIRGVWLLFAGVLLLAGILLLIVIREPKGAIGDDGGEEGDEEIPGNGEKPRYRDVFTRNTMLFFFGNIAINICTLAVLTYAPTILQAKGFDPSMAGLAGTSPMALALAGSLIFGSLADRLGTWQPLMVLAIGFLGPCVFLIFNCEGILLWVGIVAMGLIGMGSTPVMFVGLVKVLGRQELVPLGMGVLLTVQGVGQFLGSSFVQMLLGPSFGNTLFAGAVVMVVGLLGALSVHFAKEAGEQRM